MYYAIRHKPTGHFLPGSKRRAGFTNDKLTDPSKTAPRLFNKRHYAQSALDWWLDGPAWSKTILDQEGCVEDYEILQKLDPTRIKEEMEIVKIGLHTVKSFDDGTCLYEFLEGIGEHGKTTLQH